MKDNNQLHSSDSRSLIEKYHKRSAECKNRIKEYRDQLNSLEKTQELLETLIYQEEAKKDDNFKMIAMLADEIVDNAPVYDGTNEDECEAYDNQD